MSASNPKATLKFRDVFSAVHNPTTKISVVYNKLEVLGGLLSVIINDVTKASFRNPAGVTAWFANNSIKNVVGWQNAYHKSGLTGADFGAVPEKQPEAALDIVLNVPYFTQRDNQQHPGGTCNVTAYADVFDFYDVPRRKVNGKMWSQREDELFAFLEANHKDRHSHFDLVWMAEQYGLDASFGQARTLDQIRAEIRAGFPVVVSTLLTSAGHIVAIVGVKGRDFIVNDSWGNANTGYRDHNGAHVVYSEALMLAKMRATGCDAKWAHFIRRGDS